MKRVKLFIKSNIKLVIGIMIGLAIAGSIGVYATTVILSSNVSYDNSNSGLTSTNIQEAIDETYDKLKPTEFQVGDYVSMTPTKTTFTVPMTLTGYTSNQTIKPSELNLWRVIRINNDKTVDMISVYVSSSYVSFQGKIGYQNYIGTLNYIAKQYENQKYTSGSRYIGYDGTQTEYITDTTALEATTAPQTSSTSSSNVTSTTEAKGLGDRGYATDLNLVKKACGNLVANQAGTTTATVYWFAGRHYIYTSSVRFSFNHRDISTTGGLGQQALYYYFDTKFHTDDYSKAIRPIVTLKSGVKASSGDGSSSSPYVLP